MASTYSFRKTQNKLPKETNKLTKDSKLVSGFIFVVVSTVDLPDVDITGDLDDLRTAGFILAEGGTGPGFPAKKDSSILARGCLRTKIFKNKTMLGCWLWPLQKKGPGR